MRQPGTIPCAGRRRGPCGGAVRALLLLLLAALCLLPGCRKGEEAPETFEVCKPVEKGPIKAKVELLRSTLSVLDTQKLKLTVEAPAGMRITSPGLAERLEDFRHVPWHSDEDEVVEGRQHLTKYLAFELYESGPQVVPPLVVSYSSGFGANLITGELRTPKLDFTITPAGNASLAAKPLAPPADLIRPLPFPWRLVLLGVAAGLLALGVGLYGFLLWWRRRNQPPPPPPPAHRLAYRELQELVDRQKAGELGSEAFVAALADVLRRYIERRFGLRAPEQTTEEFLAALAGKTGPLAPQRQVLGRFLEFSDLVKFATRKVDAEDLSRGFEFLKEFIEATRVRDEETPA